jgi:hypothetical protein
MTADAMLKELETACAALGVQVSYEALTASVGMGGLCRVKGKYRVIIDKRASAQERASTLAEAMARLDTARVELSAKVRQLVDSYALRRAS